ncbi:sigma 54-interacting transcriptional regulator [Commensalibacter papalotli (ex Botero et al. 2024)]|uniref:DNA-binding transcriptional regulator NtrC n=1 Tax=Commensalibacter papalotli (ex Botero et al. 2024) TaxID=2972766 RepID=A0ABN8W8J8_9PROT|nr:sigma 54-interacting transcriptional regulator [Commensalibacter papalotli (ex Botero et al. 2024)]CAI3923717.1 AAA-type ATPase [Commensalibacter papalotli (ex Botero et al. 2024)]CAI3928399.1 AAA-type ATPase [Commensalibacter papalotli (ex Botero et al. 2024)]
MFQNAPTILVADDDRSIRTVLKQALNRAKYNVELTDNATELWQWVCAGKGDVIITDVSMPDKNVFEVIPKIKEINPDLPIIIISALSTLSTALQAEKESVFEYLPKPFDLDKLLNAVQQALTLSNNVNKQSEITEALPLVGKSAVMQNIYRMIARLINSDLSVIISGESGTGKEAVAKTLHHYGNRRNYPFISLNITAMSASEIENKLFGNEDTDNYQPGYLTQAAQGTLFLDEIGEMPIEVQTRLIRILKDNSKGSKLSTRIIASTRQDLFTLVQNQKFREDLYYCLNIIPVYMPPLKDRAEDIPLLIQYFLQENSSSTTLTEQSINLLKAYHWPGNIRELRNLVVRLAALYPNQLIQDDLITKSLQKKLSQKKQSETLSLSVFIEDHIRRYFFENKGLPINKLYGQMVAEVEKPLIEQTLIETEGNQIKAAAILGINRNTLRKKIKDFNITYIKIKA